MSGPVAAKLRGLVVACALLSSGALLGSGAAGELAAQSLGGELGLAGIENYDPFTPTAGASLYVPVVGRLSLAATYSRWTGRDGNARGGRS